MFPKTWIKEHLEGKGAGARVALTATVKGVKIMAVGYKYARTRPAQTFITTRGSMEDGAPYICKYRDAHGSRCIKLVPRPGLVSDYYAHANMIDIHNHIRQGLIRLEKAWKAKSPWPRLWSTAFGCMLTTAYRLRQSVPGQQNLSVSEFLNATSQSLLRTTNFRGASGSGSSTGAQPAPSWLSAASAPGTASAPTHTCVLNGKRKNEKGVKKRQCMVCSRLNQLDGDIAIRAAAKRQRCTFACKECGHAICRDRKCWDVHVTLGGLPDPNPDRRNPGWVQYTPYHSRDMEQQQ
eukprot:g3925.t1